MTEPVPEVVEETMEVVEEEEVKPSLPPISMNIVALVHNIRVQNGIRHSLYQRYRHYCSRRLLRVRRKLNVKQVCFVVWWWWWCFFLFGCFERCVLYPRENMIC